MNRAMYLTTGKKYDVSKLRLACWRDADGDLLLPTTDGYHFADYFRDGVYLGPDDDGVCPLFDPDSVHPPQKPLRHSQCSVQPGEGVAILDFGSECFEVPVVMVDGLPEANPSESTLDALEEWLSDSEIGDLLHRCEAVQAEQTGETT